MAMREIGIIFRDAFRDQRPGQRFSKKIGQLRSPAESADVRKMASLPIGKTAKKMPEIVIIRCIRMGSITGPIWICGRKCCRFSSGMV